MREAQRMRWCGRHPTAKRLSGDNRNGIRLSKTEMKPYEARLERSPVLPKYDTMIKPSGRQTKSCRSPRPC